MRCGLISSMAFNRIDAKPKVALESSPFVVVSGGIAKYPR